MPDGIDNRVNISSVPTPMAPSRWSAALESARSTSQLVAGVLQVWAVDLSPWIECSLPPWLDEIERTRAARITDAGVRATWTLGRLFLRAALGAHLGTPPDEVDIVAVPGRAPGVASGPLTFSVAHSQDLLLVAVGAGQPVGVDVEVVPAWSVAELAATVLSAEERGTGTPDPALLSDQILRTWVRKEAVTKALRLGLSLPFDTFTVDDEGWVHGAPDLGGARLRVLNLQPWEHAYSALAAHHTDQAELSIV